MEIRDADNGFVLKILQDVHTPSDDNVDVEVTLVGGERFTATFITLRNIESTMREWQKSGECLSGKYFWTTELIVIDDLNPDSIRLVVADLLKKGELFRAFGGPHSD